MSDTNESLTGRFTQIRNELGEIACPLCGGSEEVSIENDVGRMETYGCPVCIERQYRTDLAAANARAEELQGAQKKLWDTRESHAKLCTAIKKALGYKSHPKYEGKSFVDGLIDDLASTSDTLRSENAAMREALDKADACLDSLTGLLDSDTEDRELAKVRVGEYSRASHYARLTTQEGESMFCSCEKPSCDNDGICLNCGKDAP